MADRRRALKLFALAAAWVSGSAHTPYRQWQVYRQRHLLIGTSKADAPTYPLGQEIAGLLAAHLPEASARVTRGPDPWRLASLLTSGQLEVILLSAADALALQDGRAPFEAFGATPIRALFGFGDHYLICRPDFADHHAYLVVGTLTEHGGGIEGAAPADPVTSPVPIHPGAVAYARGRPMPSPTGHAAAPIPVDHLD